MKRIICFRRHRDNDGVLAGETERKRESTFLPLATVGLWRKRAAQV